MNIGILLTGKTAEQIAEQHGEYDQMFVDFFAGQDLNFRSYSVVDGEFPQSVDEQEGYIVTGSRHGVYEDHPWIEPLAQLIRDIYAADLPLVGICFGHQMIAKALGGQVEKFDGGWALGTQHYQFSNGVQQRVAAWHQDQILQAPAEASTIASNAFCKHAALRYGDRILSFQSHPEFSHDILALLARYRGDTLPEADRQALMVNLDSDTPDHCLSDDIAHFLKTREVQIDKQPIDAPAMGAANLGSDHAPTNTAREKT